MSAAVTTTPSFSAGTPQKLFAGAYETLYDVARDENRFLMIRGGPDSGSHELNVILNWSTELQRRTALAR